MTTQPTAGAMRAAELCLCHFCNYPVMPSKDRIPKLAALIDAETGLPELVALLGRALVTLETADSYFIARNCRNVEMQITTDARAAIAKHSHPQK